MKKIEGMIAASFTPFDNNMEVNLAPIGAYAELLRGNGIKGVFVNGSSGEGYMLSTAEREMLAERWMSERRDDFIVMVHVGSCSLKESVALAAHAQKIGADAVSTMAPPFPKINRLNELVDYCAAIAAAAPQLPFYYYHIPVFNGAHFSMVEFLKMAEDRIPNLAGIKYTFESLYDFNQCSIYKDGKFDLLHGQDETILNSLVMGHTKGGISGTASYIGSTLVGVMDAYAKGDTAGAVAYQEYAQAVINVIARYRGNIVAGKRIMGMMGLDLGGNRTPFQNLSDQELAQVRSELEAVDFFNHCNK